jgi:hypothetical protein
MKLFAAALLLLAPPAFAADCLHGPAGAMVPPMSVVAPEMQRPGVADPLCVAANDALARIHAQAAIAAANAPGAYKPLTKDDNSPWRFDMSQNGRRMTADEFEAWMKAKGIRVAKGKSAEPAPPPPPPPPGG